MEFTGAAIPAARVTGIALIGLSVACLPGRAVLGMLTYSALVMLCLGYLGIVGGFTGLLLWPTVIVHAVLTVLLARLWLKIRKDILTYGAINSVAVAKLLYCHKVP